MSVRSIEDLWFDEGVWARGARGVLRAGSLAWAGATSVRNALYDHGLLRVHQPVVPALALGNLSVGGTGKTPVAAWAARELRRRGAHPAIVLRGYGDDEPLVHARLNPEIPVVADPDRVRGTATAASAGADCVVLDDAFQHRRIARVADWVLVAAESWHDGGSLRPAGPLREPPAALRRASVVIVTRKTASLAAAESIAEGLSRHVPGRAWAVVALAPDALVALDGARAPLERLSGGRGVAVAAVGAPEAFFGQLRALGAEVEAVRFRDHHRFTPGDVAQIARRAERRDGVVCTLKDAVKLAPLWRGGMPPLWYVSQAAAVDRGRAHLDASLEAVLTARVHSL